MDDKESFDQFCQQVGLEKECGEASWNLWESVSSKMSKTSKVQEHCCLLTLYMWCGGKGDTVRGGVDTGC